jgi:hypothetical protein
MFLELDDVSLSYETAIVRLPFGPCPSRSRIILDAEHGIG